MASAEFGALNDAMVRELFRLNPDAGTRFGLHDPYDGMLPHGGFRRLEKTADLFTEWLRRAEKAASSEELDFDERTSMEVLRMTEGLVRFARDDYPLWQIYPEATEVPGAALLLMLARDYATPGEKAAWVSSRIGEVPRYLEEYRTRFRPGRPAKEWASMAAEAAKGFPQFLEYLGKHYAGDAAGRVGAELSKNVARAVEAMDEHLEWVVSLEEHASPGFAMGPERLGKLLRLRGFGSTPEQVLAFGESSLRQLKAERDRVGSEMARGGPLEDAVEVIRSDSPPDFDAAFAETRAEVERAKRFVIDNDIATLDYDARLHVLETPSFMASTVTSAALEMAAPFEERQQGVLMLTRVSGEALRDQYSRASIGNLAVHEAFPGHFHQGVMSNRMPWMHQLSLMPIEPDTMVPSWETQEGWGMYCEKMMLDRGFRTSPSDTHAMLDYAIWRACRIVYDVKLARGDATVDEMVRMFERETGSPHDVVRAEVLGFSRNPGYGLSYLTGRQMVFDLKRDLVGELGGSFSEKRFHDLVALNGNLPFHLAGRAVRRGFGLAAGA
ncbi:MAG: DUF885 family protein [Candidatus Thermoplasmatota archaeon]